MINHCRTLLLNRRRQEDATTGEFIPKEYLPLRLSGYLLEMHNALFPGDPDADRKNHMVRYYMSLMHSVDFRKYLIWFDTRLTYEPYVDHKDYVRPGLSEFGPLYRTLSSLFNTHFNKFVSDPSVDEDLRKSLVDANKLVITDHDRLTVILFMYLLRVEGVRRG